MNKEQIRNIFEDKKLTNSTILINIKLPFTDKSKQLAIHNIIHPLPIILTNMKQKISVSNSSLSRIDSFESDKELIHQGKKNDKKSLFFKYGPIDGNIIYTYGIDARIGKKDLKRDRTYTIVEEQKEQLFLKPQEIQRRKSAEGSQFGFLNKRIISFDYLAPFHPNHKSPSKQYKEKISSPVVDLSPMRKVKETQKTRIYRDGIDQANQDSRVQKRISVAGKTNIFNMSNINNNNNTINTLDDIKFQERTPVGGNQSYSKSNSRNGTVIKPVQINQSLLSFDSHIQQQQQAVAQSQVIEENNSPKQTQQQQQQQLQQPQQQQQQMAQQLQHRKKSDEIQRERNQSNSTLKTKINFTSNDKSLNQQKSQQSILVKNRRTHTHTDFSEFQNGTLSNVKQQNPISNKLIKHNDTKEEFHSSPSNVALFFSVHKKSPSNQIIQKYMTLNGQVNTTNGSSGFQDKVQQERFLQSDGLHLKKDYQKKGNGGNKKEKLAPLFINEKKVPKTSQQLFSKVYISQNPLYKKKPTQGKRVTLPEIHSVKNNTNSPKSNIQSNTDLIQNGNVREPLSQKQLEEVNQPDENSQHPVLDKQQSQSSKKESDVKGENKPHYNKSLHENSENKIVIKKQSIKSIKKYENNLQQLYGSNKKQSVPHIK